MAALSLTLSCLSSKEPRSGEKAGDRFRASPSHGISSSSSSFHYYFPFFLLQLERKGFVYFLPLSPAPPRSQKWRRLAFFSFKHIIAVVVLTAAFICTAFPGFPSPIPPQSGFRARLLLPVAEPDGSPRLSFHGGWSRGRLQLPLFSAPMQIKEELGLTRGFDGGGDERRDPLGLSGSNGEGEEERRRSCRLQCASRTGEGKSWCCPRAAGAETGIPALSSCLRLRREAVSSPLFTSLTQKQLGKGAYRTSRRFSALLNKEISSEFIPDLGFFHPPPLQRFTF